MTRITNRDAALFALLDKRTALVAKYKKVSAKAAVLRRRADNDPDMRKIRSEEKAAFSRSTADVQRRYKRMQEIWNRHGWTPVARERERLHGKLADLTDLIMDTRAKTAAGIAAKLKILGQAAGKYLDRDMPGNGGDEDLAILQRAEAPWLRSIIGDVKRLTQRAAA